MQNCGDAMVVLLAVAGAGVDAMMILGFNVLTAAQTGNTILLAVAIARGDFAGGLGSAISVGAFVCGTFCGAFVIGHRAPGSRVSGVAAALSAELALFVVLLALWAGFGALPTGASANLLVALAAAAMGMQSAVSLSLHARSTTYITGILAGFSSGVARRWDLAAGRRETAVPREGENPWVNGLVWLVYAVGAVGTGIVYLHIGPCAIFLPILAVFVVLVMEWKGHGRIGLS